MTDLDNLKSTGKKLIYLAWAIEIIVAAVGLTMAYSFITDSGTKAQEAGAAITSDSELLIMGLAFGVVALMELTKIPFSIALYNSAKANWRVIFFVALIAVNFSTFETIIQGFELAYNERSKVVDIKRKELDLLKAELKTKKDEDVEESKLNEDIDIIQAQIKNLRDQIEIENQNISEIKKNKNIEIANLIKSYESAGSEGKQLSAQIKSLEDKNKILQISLDKPNKSILSIETQISKKRDDLKRYENTKIQLISDLSKIKDIKGFLGAGAERKRQRETNAAEQKRIEDLIIKTNNDIDKLENDLSDAITQSRQKVENEIKNNEEEIKRLRSELSTSTAQEKSNREPQIKVIEDNAKEDIEIVNKRISQLENEINSIQTNQLQNVQSAKSEFSKNKDLSLKERSAKQKEIDNKNKEFNDIAADNQIYRLALSLKLGPSRWIFGEEKVKDGFTYHDLTQADIGRAFWIWFGFLAFIISIIGTLVAFAGLHLQDKTIHEKREQDLRSKTTLLYRLRSLVVNLSRYLRTSVSVMLKPRTVEKIVEKEVEIEKIVEKPVIEEKIVYQKVEVPKEVIKKELVHVPLWTQDPGLIDRKIDIPETQDKPKKKK